MNEETKNNNLETVPEWIKPTYKMREYTTVLPFNTDSYTFEFNLSKPIYLIDVKVEGKLSIKDKHSLILDEDTFSNYGQATYNIYAEVKKVLKIQLSFTGIRKGKITLRYIGDILQSQYTGETAIEGYEEEILLANQTTPITSNTEYTAKEVFGKHAVFYLNVSTVPASYSDETLIVKVYEVSPNGDEFLIATFNTFTSATGTDRQTVNPLYGNKLKVKAEVSGTAPSYAFKVHAIVKR